MQKPTQIRKDNSTWSFVDHNETIIMSSSNICLVTQRMTALEEYCNALERDIVRISKALEVTYD
jgi:hypothetical protein